MCGFLSFYMAAAGSGTASLIKLSCCLKLHSGKPAGIPGGCLTGTAGGAPFSYTCLNRSRH